LAANIKNDTKSLCAYVNSRCKSKVRVGPLVADNGNIVADAEDMSEQLNEYFTSVFTTENLSSIPSTDTVAKDNEYSFLSDIEVDHAVVINWQVFVQTRLLDQMISLLEF